MAVEHDQISLLLLKITVISEVELKLLSNQSRHHSAEVYNYCAAALALPVFFPIMLIHCLTFKKLLHDTRHSNLQGMHLGKKKIWIFFGGRRGW